VKHQMSSTFRLRILVALAGGLVCFAGLGHAGGKDSFGLAPDPSPVADLKNGWHIFMHGVTAQNRIVQNSHGMEGGRLCHVPRRGRPGWLHAQLIRT
jgi:hypothetical protein